MTTNVSSERAEAHWEVGGERGRWSVALRAKWTPCAATFLVYWQKKYNKRGGWRCGLPRLVSTFLADNKACLCLDEPLWALSFHNPRPLSLCFADPLCQWIKIWAEGMDWAFQRCFIKRRQTHQSETEKNPLLTLFHLWLAPNMFQKRTRVKTGGVKNHFFTCHSVTFLSWCISQNSEKNHSLGAKLN